MANRKMIIATGSEELLRELNDLIVALDVPDDVIEPKKDKK